MKPKPVVEKKSKSVTFKDASRTMTCTKSKKKACKLTWKVDVSGGVKLGSLKKKFQICRGKKCVRAGLKGTTVQKNFGRPKARKSGTYTAKVKARKSGTYTAK